MAVLRLKMSYAQFEDFLTGRFKHHIGVDDESLGWSPFDTMLIRNCKQPGTMTKLRCLYSREFAREVITELKQRKMIGEA